MVRRAPDAVLEGVMGRGAVLGRLFAALAARFDPVAADGFAGEIVFALSDRRGAVRAWTIAVDGTRARARRGGADAPAVTLKLGLADLARLAAGDLDPGAALLDGRLDVEGDWRVATALGPMFGLRSPV